MINYPSSINSSRNEVAQNEIFLSFFFQLMSWKDDSEVDSHWYLHCCIYKICHFKMQYICSKNAQDSKFTKNRHRHQKRNHVFLPFFFVFFLASFLQKCILLASLGSHRKMWWIFSRSALFQWANPLFCLFCFILLCFVLVCLFLSLFVCLFCFVLFCFVLFCFGLFVCFFLCLVCFVLFCFVLFWFVLYCFALFCFGCFGLFCFILFYFVLFCLFCFILFCFILFCFVLFV